MTIIVTGSVAFDYLTTFPGRFREQILPEHLNKLSVSFLVDSKQSFRGGTGPNIAYSLALLGNRPKLFAAAGKDFGEFQQWLETQGVDTSDMGIFPDEFTATFSVITDLDHNQIASFHTGAMARARELSLHQLDGEAIDSLAKMQLQRDLWGTKKPQWGYNACAHRWPAFQALPDIGGMDHYCVFAPKCNTNWPPFYWDHLWFLGYYAESAKINSEPRPVWDWTQANNWGDLYFFNRCLTDEEIRAQWYVVLGRGVKGLLWFRFSKEWMNTCPGPLPEMKRLARELETVKPIALEGEWMTPGLTATTPDSTIDTQATFGPRGALIVLTNFHYDLNLIAPWIWHEKINIPIDVYPPESFEPARFQLVVNEDLIDLAWAKIDEGHWRVMLPSLTVAEMILVTPEP